MFAGGGRGSSSDFKVVNGKIRHATDDLNDVVTEERRVRFLQSSVKDDIRDTDKGNNKVKAKQIFNQNSSIPILGINSPINNNYQELCFDNSQLWGSQVDNKFKVIKVVENSQAELLGLKIGDEVKKINGVNLTNLDQWNNAKKNSEFTTLTISHNQNIINHIVNTNNDEDDTYDRTFLNKVFGIVVKRDIEILRIEPGSEAEANGLKVGHVITTIINSRTGDEFPVNNSESYLEYISALKKLDIPVTIRIKKVKNTSVQVNKEFILPSPYIEPHFLIPGHNVIVPRHNVIVPGNVIVQGNRVGSVFFKLG